MILIRAMKYVWDRIASAFGCRCPKCYSKKFWTQPIMMYDRNGCHDCGHKWID